MATSLPITDRAGRSRRAASRLAILVLACAVCSSASAQSPVEGVRGTLVDSSPAPDPKRQLQDVETSLTQSDEQRRKMAADIEQARTDRQHFNQALIDTTARVRDGEARMADTTARLDSLDGSEEAIRKSLESRRDVIAEVLAALQRIGHKPPPAMLVRPEDILKTIRSSILLGAVLPEMRAQVETLAADLTELARLRAAATAERDTLGAQTAALKAETERLQGLVAARQKAQSEAESTLDQETAKAADLARQASSLKDLIARMEGANASARKAADAARAADEQQRKAAESDSQGVQAKVAAGIFQDPARLQPAVPFASTRGLLPMPISGRIIKAFGQSDGYGGTEKGVSFATRPKAIVTSPADGWVSFSGPYRAYGQVLILNQGGGYYTVLAGIDHVDVAPGQFVLSGEPVGVMGDGSVKAAAAIALGASNPVLYVEFRKDGTAIDPSPWWAKAALEKVRG